MPRDPHVPSCGTSPGTAEVEALPSGTHQPRHPADTKRCGCIGSASDPGRKGSCVQGWDFRGSGIADMLLEVPFISSQAKQCVIKPCPRHVTQHMQTHCPGFYQGISFGVEWWFLTGKASLFLLTKEFQPRYLLKCKIWLPQTSANKVSKPPTKGGKNHCHSFYQEVIPLMNEFFLFFLRMNKTTGMSLPIKSLVSQLPGRVRDETLALAASINK